MRRRAKGTVPPPDPKDPVQSLYSEEDDAVAFGNPADETLDDVEVGVSETGELYGVHTPRAQDNIHPDDDVAMQDGQNWLEALQTDAVEGGTMPEHELDMSDDADNDRPPHRSDMRDIPIADRGAGGPGGA